MKSQRSWPRRFTYWLTCVMVRLLVTPFAGLRLRGSERVPREGGGLVCANHQSFLDPLLMGVCFPRRMNFLARDTLFRGWFGDMIRWYDAIPLQREGLGIGGMRESLRRLKNGELLLLFPEGTRSTDGRMQPFQAGFIALARRAKVPVIPLAIEGAYDAWPRSRRYPRPAPIRLVVGRMLSVAEIAAMTDEQFVEETERRIRECWNEARTSLGKPADRSQPQGTRTQGALAS